MGKIFKNDFGRYESEATVFTSGDKVSINLGTEEVAQWVDGWIEHDGEDYYFLSPSDKHIHLKDGDILKER